MNVTLYPNTSAPASGINFGVTSTVTNLSGGTVTYSDTQDPFVAEGTLTVGSSVELRGSYFFRATETTLISHVPVPVSEEGVDALTLRVAATEAQQTTMLSGSVILNAPTGVAATDTAHVQAKAAEAGRTKQLIWQPGTYEINDTILSGDAVTGYSWKGVRNERALFAGAYPAAYPATRIRFRPADATKPLVRMYSTTAPLSYFIGPFLHENILFDLGDANGLVFGVEDHANPTVLRPASPPAPANGTGQRYVQSPKFKGCAFTATYQDYVSAADGTLTRSGRQILSLTKAFEFTLDDCSFNGGDTQIRLFNCDRPRFSDLRMAYGGLPLDWEGSTFIVQYAMEGLQIEGWVATPWLIRNVQVAANKIRLENNNGAGLGTGRFTLPGVTAAVTQGSGALTFSAAMDNILLPNLSIIELDDGAGTKFRALVTAVAGTAVTVDTLGNWPPFTNAASSVVRIHGYGPIAQTAVAVQMQGIHVVPSINCPAFVYRPERSDFTIMGCGSPTGADGDVRSMVLGNVSPASGQLGGRMRFKGCSPKLMARPGTPFVEVDHYRDPYGAWGNSTLDIQSKSMPEGSLDDAAARVLRKWAWIPGQYDFITNTGTLNTPLVRVAGDPNTVQSIPAWWIRSDTGLLNLSDEGLPADPLAYIRLSFRVRSVAATGSIQVYFIGAGTGGGPGVVATLTSTWKTYQYIYAMPAQWTGVRTSATGVVFDRTASSDYYLAGCVVEELLPAAANPDTSGATLTALETEVNELKAALRTRGIIAP